MHARQAGLKWVFLPAHFSKGLRLPHSRAFGDGLFELPKRGAITVYEAEKNYAGASR